MPQINLLPWREQARQEKKIQFGIILGSLIGCTLLLVVIFHLYIAGLIREENRRITYLQTTMGEKQLLYNSLKDREKKQIGIQAELTFIMTLRDKSFHAVKLMNELIKVVPPTVTLEKLSSEENKITIIGKAQSELQITQLMKNIAKSPIFSRPVLTRISSIPGSLDASRVFELEVEQKVGIH